MIDKEEIKKIVETIDVLKLLSIKGESEKIEYGRLSFIWGLFGSFMFLYFGLKFSFLGKYGWIFIIFIPAFFHTLPISSFVPSFLYWALSAGVIYTILKTTSSWALFCILFITLSIFGFSFLYFLGEKRKTLRKPMPLKYSLAGKIGITWMLIFSSVSLLFYSLLSYLYKSSITINFYFLYLLIYGYALSIAIFISGLIVSFYFILGITGMFLIPIFSLYNIKLGYILISLISLIYGVYGGYVYIKGKSKERKGDDF